MSNQWKKVDSGYNMAYGEIVEQISKDVFLKNVDGKFQFVDYENSRVSPEFDFGKDADYWYSENK